MGNADFWQTLDTLDTLVASSAVTDVRYPRDSSGGTQLVVLTER